MTPSRASPPPGRTTRKPARQTAPAARALLSAEPSPIPLYHRLYVVLREQIVNGTLPVGATLPAEAELITRYGVSRITAKRALDELAREGLALRKRGRGTTVTRSGAARPGSAPIAADIDGLLASLALIGRSTAVELKTFDYVPAPADVAERLGIVPGTVVQRAVRVRHLDGMPLSRTTSHVIEAIGRTFDRDALARTPLIDLLTRAGADIARVLQTISATVADDESAHHLAVSVGSPLLRLRRIFFDAGDRAIDHVEMLYRPDRFEYRMMLSKGANDRFQVEPGETALARGRRRQAGR